MTKPPGQSFLNPRDSSTMSLHPCSIPGDWSKRRDRVAGGEGVGGMAPSPTAGQYPDSPTSVRLLAVVVLIGLLGPVGVLISSVRAGSSQTHTLESKYPWTALIAQADRLGLPARFVRAIPPGFFTVEFADLRTFAAEYHPQDHRMVLNRALSFNAAGGVLRPLAQMTPREVATLYHELFHAYMDYLSNNSDSAVAGPDAARLMAFARSQQQCRYQAVTITPLPQKKTVTEPRFLSEGESWEALNETWAVFVGWTIWTRLDLARASRKPSRDLWSSGSDFAKLLKKADQSGELVGYYEPQDEKERAITHKRHLAQSDRISPDEVALLMEILFGVTPEDAGRTSSLMSPRGRSPQRGEL